MDDSEVIRQIESWLALILEQGISVAFSDLTENEHFKNISQQEFIEKIGQSTLSSTKALDKQHAVIRLYEHELGTNTEYSLPLDGQWSTLTAVFESYLTDSGNYGLSLVELDEI